MSPYRRSTGCSPPTLGGGRGRVGATRVVRRAAGHRGAAQPRVDRVHLVHPAHREVAGRRTVPSLDALDDAPDLVLMGVPDRLVPDQLAAAAAVGAGGAVVFGSVAGAGRGGARGGRRPGAVRRRLHGLRQPAGGRARARLPRARAPAARRRSRWSPTPGRCSRRCCAPGAGSTTPWPCRRGRSSGPPPATTSSGRCSGPRPGWSGCSSRRCATPRRCGAGWPSRWSGRCPVVALTVGGSAAGRSLVTAHSGAVAGDDAGWEALFASYGVHRTRDVEELVDTLELFAVGRRVRQRRGRHRHRARLRRRADPGRRRRGGRGRAVRRR